MYDPTEDPWSAKARQRREEQAVEAAATEVTAAGKRIQWELKRAESEARERELQIAIAQAVPSLEDVLRRRGQGARELLATFGERAHVMFGSKAGGGGYHSVYFDHNGLTQEIGSGGDYGSTPNRIWAATAWEAVEYFARYGEGRGNLDQVRKIAEWFIQQVNGFMR
jgi:hypothetical protein